MLLALLGAGVFAAYVKFDAKASHVPSDLRRTEPDVDIDSKPIQKTVPATTSTASSSLLVPTIENNEVKLVKPAAATQNGVKPEVDLINQSLHSLLIKDGRAVGLEMKGHIALVDFNQAIDKGYGTIEEGNLIKALQMALGQFKGIDQFKIIVEGQPIESLGNIELTAPIDVIRPGQTSAPKTSEESNPPAPN